MNWGGSDVKTKMEEIRRLQEEDMNKSKESEDSLRWDETESKSTGAGVWQRFWAYDKPCTSAMMDGGGMEGWMLLGQMGVTHSAAGLEP